MNLEGFRRLSGALEGKKQRDAGHLAEVKDRIARLDAEVSAIDASIPVHEQAIAPGDFASWNAFEQWRRLAQERKARLIAEQNSLSADLEAARQTLLRSNGQVEAVSTLIAGR